MRREPKRLGAGKRRGSWRTALAMAGSGPPDRQLIGEVDRRYAARDMLPKATTRAGDVMRGRSVVLGAPLAAKILAPRAHPMRRNVRIGDRPRREQKAMPVPSFGVAPKGAIAAYWSFIRLAGHGVPPLSRSALASTAASFLRSSLRSSPMGISATKPPPSATISPTSACTLRALNVITVRSASSAAV